MLFMVALLAAQPVPSAPPVLPDCRPAQLELSVDGKNGDFNGMSHSGTELSFTNLGPDCTLPAWPTVTFRDAQGHALRMIHPAQTNRTAQDVHLGGGHRAAIDLRWVSGPVYSRNRSVRTGSVTVRIGATQLHAPLAAVLYGPAGKPITFDQTALRAMEGMAAH